MASLLISSREDLSIIIPMKILGQPDTQNLFFLNRFGYDYLLTMVSQAVALQCNLSCTVDQALLFRCNHQRIKEVITDPLINRAEYEWLHMAFYQLKHYLHHALSQYGLPHLLMVKVKAGAIYVQLFKAIK